MNKILRLTKQFAKMLPLCLLVMILAFYSWKFPFYEASDDAGDYTMELRQTGIEADPAFCFSYDNDRIILHYLEGLTREDIQIYGLTDDGIAVMADEHIAALVSDYTGSFFASAKVQFGDCNGDGYTDRLFYTAKTDMEFNQDNEMAGDRFGQDVAVLEVTLDYRQKVTVWLNGVPAVNKEFTCVLSDGNRVVLRSDEAGVVVELGAKQAQEGFVLIYTENDTDFYISSYVVEQNTILTFRHLQAALPFLLVLGLSGAGICLCLIFRTLYERAVYGKAYVKRKRTNGPIPGRSISGFMAARWAVMVLTWFVVFYGVYFFGTWYHNIAVPILSCGLENQSQFVSGSCYYLANLDLLFDKPLGQILLFVATTFGSVLILGRMICGFFCPMGLMQDVMHQVRCGLRVEGVQFSDRAYKALVPLKWTFVLLMIGLCFAGGKFCDVCPARILSPALSGFKTSLYLSGFLMVGVLIGSFFKRRLWCNICPLGLLLGALHKISLFQITKEGECCTACGACYEACPMGIKTVYTERAASRITDWDCIFCGECVRVCPETNALSIRFCGIKIYSSSRKRVMKRYAKGKTVRNDRK